MELAQRLFFRDQLRSARAIALADAEGFNEIIRTVELLGQYLSEGMKDFGRYKSPISELASVSPFSLDLPGTWPGFHTGLGALYDELHQARNDAVHQGAYARTLCDHAVELTIILEDALMADASVVSQFMVRNVVEVKPWQPVSYIRQQMLTRAFSYLPTWNSGGWYFVPEHSIARHLRLVASKNERRRRLATPLSEAVHEGIVELVRAETVHPEKPIKDMMPLIGERPVLVVDHEHQDVLVGLLSASDLL